MTASEQLNSAAIHPAMAVTALDYALGYIKAGWHVLPLKPNTKQPAHWLVPNGVHGATSEPRRAARAGAGRGCY